MTGHEATAALAILDPLPTALDRLSALTTTVPAERDPAGGSRATPMTETRPPPAYGYMRVPCDVEDQVIRELELKLKEHAEQHGFCLVTIFHEFQSGSLMVWDEVATELQRADAHHMIVPSLGHVADHPLLRQNMLDRLAEGAEAEVLELADPR